MQIIDDSIIIALTRLTHSAGILNSFMFLISNNALIKGGILISVLWYLWFNENDVHVHRKIIACFLSCIFAIIIGRILALTLPFRSRPILNPKFDFFYTIDNLSWVNTWSSFPSDHAVLFFSLATGIFLISKKWGIFSYSYTFIIICFPRIYLGLHYPSDILAGMIVGIFITFVIFKLKISNILPEKAINAATKYPGIFYVCFFLLTYQIATNFDDTQAFVQFIITHSKRFFQLLS